MLGTKWLRTRTTIYLLVAGALLCAAAVWKVGASASSRAMGPRVALKGVVTDTHNRPLAGAKVYFIDSPLVNTTPITPTGIIDGTAEAYDEPLEDIVNNPTLAKTLPQAVTKKDGKFSVGRLLSHGQYFPFVVPADTDHIPGGDLSRNAVIPIAVTRQGIHINVSWQPPSDATYIGTSACYVCHADDKPNFKKHAHQLSLQIPGHRDPNIQDMSAHPNIDDVYINKFTTANAFTDAGVKVLFVESYDPAGATKWLIFEDATGGGPVDAKVYLWKTAAGQYNVTIQNIANPADPTSPLTMPVVMTMGGSLFRQRLLVKPPNRKGMYRFIEFQGFPGPSQGKTLYYDRTRKPFLEAGPAGGGFGDFFKKPDNLIVLPAVTNTVQGCAVCHMSPDYKSFVDGETGETLATANGVVIDGSNAGDSVNIGCERCHGPGSMHRQEALLGGGASAARAVAKPVDHTGKFIVNPGLLCNDRASLICGRCHAGGAIADSNHYPPPGISRANYLANYVDPTQKGVPLVSRGSAKFWPDGVHQTGGHEGIIYEDWIRAKHARNTRILVACDDCHDAHGDSPYRWFLVDNPDDPNSLLCQRCHAIDVAAHALEKLGSTMAGENMSCYQCHMARTGKGAAGRPGTLLGTPTGAPTDQNIIYWENDQSSHVMDVPHKFSQGVSGVPPGTAMPVPYTNQCGVCHDATQLQFQQPQ